MKSVVEVCRVFGNLTRQKAVRDYLQQQKGKHIYETGYYMHFCLMNFLSVLVFEKDFSF